jgi:hypothetical protein
VRVVPCTRVCCLWGGVRACVCVDCTMCGVWPLDVAGMLRDVHVHWRRSPSPSPWCQPTTMSRDTPPPPPCLRELIPWPTLSAGSRRLSFRVLSGGRRPRCFVSVLWVCLSACDFSLTNRAPVPPRVGSRSCLAVCCVSLCWVGCPCCVSLPVVGGTGGRSLPRACVVQPPTRGGEDGCPTPLHSPSIVS